ncbi:unnamed protein product [Cochlearia groenlandica]
MASLSVSSSSTIIDSRAPPRQASVSASSPSCISLPSLPSPPLQSQSRAAKATSYCGKIVRSVVTRATGEVPATTEIELPEIVKTVQEAWEKVEDKYAIGSLAFAGAVAIWGSAGVISAIDRLPLVPGVLEIVGIGYTGWFAYKNLVFKPDRSKQILYITCCVLVSLKYETQDILLYVCFRDVLFKKVKDTYRDILGSSS